MACWVYRGLAAALLWCTCLACGRSVSCRLQLARRSAQRLPVTAAFLLDQADQSAALAQGNYGVLGVPGLSSSPSPVHVPSLWEVGVLQITMLPMFPPGTAAFCLICCHGAGQPWRAGCAGA
jgi:hypothetical protein